MEIENIYCFFEDIDELIELFNNGKQFTNDQIKFIQSNLQKLFIYACLKGSKEMAEWLYELSKTNLEKININAQNNDAFFWSCASGNKRLVKWLYELSTGRLEDGTVSKIKINSEYFRISCQKGHKNIAKWLYEMSKLDGNTKIDLNMDDELFFRKACKFNNKEVAEWLYNLSQTDDNKMINIHARNNCALIESCIYKNKEIVEWLCQICTDYSYIVNKKGEYIPFIKHGKLYVEDKKCNICKRNKNNWAILSTGTICVGCCMNLVRNYNF